jgi:hypothetical protein
MLNPALGTLWSFGQYICMAIGAQRQDDGSYLYNLAGAGWRAVVAGIPVEPDGALWTQCDARGTPLESGPPLTGV